MARSGVAIASDAVSSGYYFPKWHSYYAAQFGAEHIYLLTYRGHASAFADYRLGDLIELGTEYSDDARLDAVMSLVSKLLATYRTVIRVDTDEFLLPDPAYYKDLREFSDRRTAEVVNARGFDVFQKIGEPDLDFTKPILCVQRKTAFAITSLNKPSITSKLVRWNRGFHYCSETPRFDNLFLFHVKRADIRAQQLWNEFMAKNAKDDDVRAYYQTSDENIEKFHRDMSSREIVRGDRILYREDFNSDFLRTIKLWKSDGIYHGKHAAEAVNVEIPQHFSGYF